MSGNESVNAITGVRRWIVFNLVGLTGAAVQLAVLGALSVSGMEYRMATVLAVEAAVANNFAWHRRWTWADGGAFPPHDVVRRFVTFNLSVGLISIAQNVLLMIVLVERFHMNVLIANASVISLGSLINFLVSHHWVFRERQAARPVTRNRRYQT